MSLRSNWSQVKSDLDPKRFTIRTVPELLSNTTAWQDYNQSQRPLAEAIKRLANVNDT
ncbi:hypothetical protein [Brucella rhizosphaerae]|uniref:hypothetical protein n=1 Tax=Brucella rhizosphaerae TaxID=571254 RepID=UPI003D76A30F